MSLAAGRPGHGCVRVSCRGESSLAVVDLRPFLHPLPAGFRPDAPREPRSFGSSSPEHLRTPTLMVLWLVVHPGTSLILAYSRICAPLPAPWACRRPCCFGPGDTDLCHLLDQRSLGPLTRHSPCHLSFRSAAHLRAPSVLQLLRCSRVRRRPVPLRWRAWLPLVQLWPRPIHDFLFSDS